MARQHSYTGPALTANQTTTIIPAFPLENGQKITGVVWADQAGTVFVEQSADNQNWDLSESIAIAASTGVKVDEDVILAWCRVRYTNGAAGQGAVRVFLRTLAPAGL